MRLRLADAPNVERGRVWSGEDRKTWGDERRPTAVSSRK